MGIDEIQQGSKIIQKEIFNKCYKGKGLQHKNAKEIHKYLKDRFTNKDKNMRGLQYCC